jgi:hypothetical protein
LLIRVLEDAINKPIKCVRSVILGLCMAAITVMPPLLHKGRVDGHKNFDGSGEGDTSLPDHFVTAKLVKERKGERETEEKEESIRYNINPATPLESLLARSAFNIFKLLYCVATARGGFYSIYIIYSVKKAGFLSCFFLYIYILVFIFYTVS